jgi:hypothetical protein
MPAPYSAAPLLTDLGFGGDNLRQQTQDEAEEEKRRRKLGLSPLQSPAARALLGGGMGGAGMPSATMSPAARALMAGGF